MTRIPVNDVWHNIVDYYWKEIHYNTPHSIWSWVEADYNGKKQVHKNDTYIDFVFEDDADATAFKLKFLVTDDI